MIHTKNDNHILYGSLVMLHTKYTGRRENDFTAHGHAGRGGRGEDVVHPAEDQQRRRLQAGAEADVEAVDLDLRLGLYPLVTPQHSSATLERVSCHIQSLL